MMPNGRSIVLERQPGADTQGFAGLEDEVDHHWGRLFGAAALSTLLGVGSELGATGNDSGIVTALIPAGQRDTSGWLGSVIARNLLDQVDDALPHLGLLDPHERLCNCKAIARCEEIGHIVR
jgi:type IV secretion system protein VirB10